MGRKMKLLLSVLVLSVGVAMAQTRITGNVTDEKGEPVIGASILVKGTDQGTVTDLDGNFSLSVLTNAKLVISYIGMKTQEVLATSNLRIVLQSDTELLDEVVVTAMGIKKERKALGYAVQDVKSEELLKNKAPNLINSLAGKIAGVNITQSSGSAGAGAQIVLRGGTSLERDNQPLFVVDGVIYDNSTPVGGNSGFDGATRNSTTYGNRVMDINPEDIDNVSVLKGAAAAALYGSRAAAGVIVITTKKGNTDGKTEVTLSSRYTSNWVNRYPEEQTRYKRGSYNNIGNLNTDWIMSSWGEAFGPNDTQHENIRDFLQTGSSWDNTVTISGGNQTGSFYLSASHYDQDGIVPKTGYDKSTVRFNADRTYGKFNIAINSAFSKSSTQKTFTSGGLYNASSNGAMEAVYLWPRSENMSKYLNEDGSKYRIFQGLDPQNQSLDNDIENPYWIIHKNRIGDETTRLSGSVTPSYKLTDWLTLTYRMGIDRYNMTDRTVIAENGAVAPEFQKGRLSENDVTYEYLNSNLMLTASKRVNDFDLNLLLGQSVEDTKSTVNRRTGYKFIVSDFPSFDNINDGNKRLQSNRTQKRLMGVYGEFRASYKSLLYLTLTGRNDWTSTLPVDNRSYFYPSIGSSFVFSELFPENTIFSFGKVRASWARVGKDTDAYATTTSLFAPLEFLAGTGVGNSWERGNPYLKPEITESTELGLEMRFLKGRLGFDLTYYTNNSKNQIVSPRLSQANGYILYKVNVGNIYNKGLELSITGTPVQTKDLQWTTTLNLAGNRGTVDHLLDGMKLLYVTDVQIGGVKAASVNGGDFMAITGNKWKRDDAGNPILDAITGMPTYDNTQTNYVGNREPKFIGGWNNSIQWKNFNLSFLLDFRVGGDIYNGTDYFMTVNGRSKRTENREKLTINGVVQTEKEITENGETKKVLVSEPKSFTFEADKRYDILNKDGSVKTYRYGREIIEEYYKTYYPAEAANFITKTNWLRLRSLSLSYSLPKSLLAKTGFIKACTVSATGNNLLLFTNYKGLDPEASVAGSGVTGSSSTGIDYCGVPNTMSASFGVNLTF